MDDTKKPKAGFARAGVVVTVLALFLVQVCVSALYVVTSAVTPENVSALVAESDLLPTMVAGSAGSADASTLELLTTLTSDAEVKKVFGDYLGEVVADVRTGSNLASINQLALKDAVTPYMGDLVDATYPEIVEAHPIARPYLITAAGDTVVASIEASMGDPATLLSASGVDASGVESARFVLSGTLRGILLAVVCALGVCLAVLQRKRKTGLLWWAGISLGIAVLFGVLGATALYADSAMHVAYAPLINPANRALVVTGAVNAVLGVGLAAIFLLGRRRAGGGLVRPA